MMNKAQLICGTEAKYSYLVILSLEKACTFEQYVVQSTECLQFA